MNARLALGTAQFGMAYGVANRTGQVSPAEAQRILHEARSSGIDTLDTAMAYGESEQCLGAAGMSDWRVVTKLPPVPQDCPDVHAWVEQRVAESLARLRVAGVYGLLLHRPLQLLGEYGAALHGALNALRERGVAAKVGVSVYAPQELELLWPRFELDIVQAPLNVLDRRLLTSGWLGRLAGAGVEVHARSVFLQGLLLMSPGQRPPRFAAWEPLWAAWDGWLARQDVSAVEACLGYVLGQREVARAVVGVDGLAQLQGILQRATATVPAPPAAISSADPELIDPSRWN